MQTEIRACQLCGQDYEVSWADGIDPDEYDDRLCGFHAAFIDLDLDEDL